MSEKPIVFFSHSSRDARAIARFKEIFVAATGGSVDVFLSSDGQSIPLGRNWVHKIEEALERSGLMVVFVSPSSLRSSWLFFESGFAYAKKIRVVPVGFLGVDLSALPPPLNLLQGFNITSEEGLNNVIAVTNDVFQHSHRPAFSAENYKEICGAGGSFSAAALGDYGALVDNISTQLKEKEDLSCTVGEALDLLASLFDREGAEHDRSAHGLDLYGISFIGDTSGLPCRLTVRIDPSLADIALPILEKALCELRPGGICGTRITMQFVPTVDRLRGRHKITGRVYGTDVKIAPNDHLIRGDIRFNIDQFINWSQSSGQKGATYVELELLGKSVPTEQIRNLVAFLFERGLLFLEPQYVFSAG